MRARLMSRLGRYAGLRFFRFLARPLEAQARAGGSDHWASTMRRRPSRFARKALDLRQDNVAAAFRRGTYAWVHSTGRSRRLLASVRAPSSRAPRVGEVCPECGVDLQEPGAAAYRGRGIAAALDLHADAAYCERDRTYSLSYAPGIRARAARRTSAGVPNSRTGARRRLCSATASPSFAVIAGSEGDAVSAAVVYLEPCPEWSDEPECFELPDAAALPDDEEDDFPFD